MFAILQMSFPQFWILNTCRKGQLTIARAGITLIRAGRVPDERGNRRDVSAYASGKPLNQCKEPSLWPAPTTEHRSPNSPLGICGGPTSANANGEPCERITPLVAMPGAT